MNRVPSVILFALKQEQNYSYTLAPFMHISFADVMKYSWNFYWSFVIYSKK